MATGGSIEHHCPKGNTVIQFNDLDFKSLRTGVGHCAVRIRNADTGKWIEVRRFTNGKDAVAYAGRLAAYKHGTYDDEVFNDLNQLSHP